MIPKGIY